MLASTPFKKKTNYDRYSSDIYKKKKTDTVNHYCILSLFRKDIYLMIKKNIFNIC